MSKRALSPQQFTLYHGTTGNGAREIDEHGIEPNDMGMVYATKDPDRAEMWARRRAEDNGDAPMIVEFTAHESKVTDAAREGEVVHWGKVHAKAIKSIYEAEVY